jgi:hypothetical protein
VLLGYLFWQSFDQAIAIAKRGSLALAATVALLVCLVAAYRYLRGGRRRADDRGPDNRALAAPGGPDALRQGPSCVENAPNLQGAPQQSNQHAR